MRIVSIDLDFGKYWKSNFISIDFLFYLCVFVRLLFKELIAWEGHDFESFIMVQRVEFSKLFVVWGAETSLSCHIDDEENLNDSIIFLEFNKFSIDVFDLEIEEVINIVIGDSLLLSLEDDFPDYWSHLHKNFIILILV